MLAAATTTIIGMMIVTVIVHPGLVRVFENSFASLII